MNALEATAAILATGEPFFLCANGHTWPCPEVEEGLFDLCAPCPTCGEPGEQLTAEIQNLSPGGVTLFGTIEGDLTMQDETSQEATEPTTPAPPRRGFAAIDPRLQREIAAKGGRAAHAQGRAHQFTSEEARIAGRKGGRAVHEKRGAAHMARIGAIGGAAAKKGDDK